ncbi:MAG: phosphoribosylaminoimidazolecarboxamide formyltransferase [Flaviaesturariibacter sp.]|nr:phosphoribosylaminoimidazolecarboxamide formyltransferase [Flaviaesturariibacter sp.]
MKKKISAALLSVFYKDGLEPLVRQLSSQGTTLYSTGGTQAFIEGLGIEVIPVESLTSYPSILGGRVKTLHPLVFGGILGKRADAMHLNDMLEYGIPEIDLVVVDLYPFQETVAQTNDEAQIIEKIDIGGPSMIRAAAKNFSDVVVIASKDDYSGLVETLQAQEGETTLEQRKAYAAKAFQVVADYDIAITNYFSADTPLTVFGKEQQTPLRYGENPHQKAAFFGDLSQCFTQLHGKEISYNNLVDIDAAVELIRDAAPSGFPGGGEPQAQGQLSGDPAINTSASQSGPGAVGGPSYREGSGMGSAVFAIIKHTNPCGVASRSTVAEAWTAALASDPESAFGGVLVCNGTIDVATATAINEIFFEVLLAPSFEEEALSILKSRKNRILLQMKEKAFASKVYKSLLNGTLVQDKDNSNYERWEEVGGKESGAQKDDLGFANLICKHLKSNAIALVKDGQLIGKGCGQTSRIDALRQALEKARQFNFDLTGAVMASDAFFPFNDCVQLGYEAGITAFIQPGGSIRDKDSIDYCKEHGLAMVLTGTRHFRH